MVTWFLGRKHKVFPEMGSISAWQFSGGETVGTHCKFNTHLSQHTHTKPTMKFIRTSNAQWHRQFPQLASRFWFQGWKVLRIRSECAGWRTFVHGRSHQSPGEVLHLSINVVPLVASNDRLDFDVPHFYGWCNHISDQSYGFVWK